MKTSFYNKQFLSATTLVLGILGGTTAQAQTAVWTNRYNGPGGLDYATLMAVDGSGNVVVAGESYNTNGFPDYATIKYSDSGMPLWTNRFDGLGNVHDFPHGIAVDTDDNVFVTGSSFDSNGYSDYATIKYSGAGVALWTNRYNGTGNGGAVAYAVAVDNNSDVFVTGYSYGSDGHTFDYSTIKYSGAGVPLWTNRYDGPGNNDDYAFAIAVDTNGDVFVTGYSYNTNGFPDYATIKYSGAGGALWTNRFDGLGSVYGLKSAIAVDGSGDVFVTGFSTGSGSDYATIKYSGAGMPLWTNRYNGSANAGDAATAMAVDTNGDVFVTGYSAGGGSYNDYATIKYSGAGVPLWTNRYNGPDNSDDSAYAMAVDGGGNVFVTGGATIAYSGAGVALWTNRYDEPGNNDALAIAVDGSGNVFVTGTSSGGYATIKYSAIPPSLTIARTTINTVVISWPAPSTGFTLQSTTNLVSPAVWNTNSTSPVVINGQNRVTNPISGTQQFFRLSQ